mmetsp:Transcript_36177/g.111480  ORF Transcript_36177/g.111480 Transcript_36177/m.111480 type:complete len:232 (-) Transcript_36177:150-845(-)
MTERTHGCPASAPMSSCVELATARAPSSPRSCDSVEGRSRPKTKLALCGSHCDSGVLGAVSGSSEIPPNTYTATNRQTSARWSESMTANFSTVSDGTAPPAINGLQSRSRSSRTASASASSASHARSIRSKSAGTASARWTENARSGMIRVVSDPLLLELGWVNGCESDPSFFGMPHRTIHVASEGSDVDASVRSCRALTSERRRRDISISAGYCRPHRLTKPPSGFTANA